MRIGAKARATIAAALAAMIPILLSALFACLQAIHDQTDRASILAGEALKRSGTTNDQLFAAFQAFAGVGPNDACSSENIIRMRQVVLSATFLGGFGFVSGNDLRCSSFGGETAPLDVGPPDFITATGYAVRERRELSFAPGTALLLASAPTGFTGIYHPSLVLTVAGAEDDVSLGIIGASTGRVLMSAGQHEVAWEGYDLPAPGSRAVRVADGQIVALQRSQKWDHFAYAAIPLVAVAREFERLLVRVLPLGFIAGIVVFVLAQRFIQGRTSILALLKTALRRNEITVEFQPIVDMASGRWIGAEALARWRLQTGEEVPADVFIRLAEEHGLIRQVTQLVLATGMREMAPLMRASPSFFVSFNLSAADLEDASLPEHVEKLMRQHSLEPTNVHLEITERQAVEGAAQIGAIAELRSRGLHVGTDDFGIGFSNLSYLAQVPLDYIKIDRSLIASSVRDSVGYDIIETIVHLADAHGIQIIAEGVEWETQRAQLLERGVRFAQGWLFAKSMPSSKFIAGFGQPVGNVLGRVGTAGDELTLHRVGLTAV